MVVERCWERMNGDSRIATLSRIFLSVSLSLSSVNANAAVELFAD